MEWLAMDKVARLLYFSGVAFATYPSIVVAEPSEADCIMYKAQADELYRKIEMGRNHVSGSAEFQYYFQKKLDIMQKTADSFASMCNS